MTTKQFYLTLFIFTLSLRVQKLPSLLSSKLGKDSYLLILFYFVVDVLLIMIAFWVLKYMRKNQLSTNSLLSKIIKSASLVLVSAYFMLQCLLMYEAIQDLFAHVLFDNLPWTLFSLLLIVALFYMAFSGLKGIGRMVEVYFFVILSGYVLITIFGAMHTDFSEILPLETINFKSISDSFITFNLWFGDFFLILFLGKHCESIKLKWTLLVYTISMSLVTLLVVEFYGMYGIYSPMQPSLITVLSEQSMLGVDVGRIDWFFILFTEIGTIICSGLCLFLAKQCLAEVFPKIKAKYLLLVLCLALYIADVVYLVDYTSKEALFLGFISYFSFYLKLGVLFLLLILCWFKTGQKKVQKGSSQLKLEKQQEARLK